MRSIIVAAFSIALLSKEVYASPMEIREEDGFPAPVETYVFDEPAQRFGVKPQEAAVTNSVEQAYLSAERDSGQTEISNAYTSEVVSAPNEALSSLTSSSANPVPFPSGLLLRV